jgi:cellulose biosynthesis protein BcsQ
MARAQKESTMLTDDADMPVIDRESLSRVVTTGNGKGGVGKTTVAANTAGLAAADNTAVLLIDLNGQGNVGRELGYREGPLDDDGRALADAIAEGAPLRPVSSGRPNLDVCVGGSAVGHLPAILANRYQFQSERQALM